MHSRDSMCPGSDTIKVFLTGVASLYHMLNACRVHHTGQVDKWSKKDMPVKKSFDNWMVRSRCWNFTRLEKH
jgi:hypothetical protein